MTPFEQNGTTKEDKMLRGPLIRHLALAGVALAFSAVVHASDYPTKPITLFVPFATGGATQTLVERVGREMQRDLGQPLIPDYRGGAGGSIAAEAAARSPHDGYTLFMGATGALAVAPAVMKVRFDPEKDFVPIALIATTPYVMVINTKLPFKNLQDLIQYAKQNPGKLNFGSSGAGGSDHIACEVFQKMAGITITHIAYKGAGPLMPDLISGRIDMAILSPIPVKPQVEAGTLRMLGVTTKQRSPSLKDVPSIAEQGLPAYDLLAWYGFFAPAGAPAEVVTRINAAALKALANKDVESYLLSQGLTPGTLTPAAFGELVRKDITQWGDYARSTGVRIE
jgi:tripartite-type tricarboxylate transporter receptor subunit TctC